MKPVLSLMYHNVCAERATDGSWPGFEDLSPSITGYFVDRQTFERQCALIAASGRAEPAMPTGNSVDDVLPRIHITFDDGWRGTIDEAGPILQSYGLHALLFVTTDLIGHPQFVDQHQLTECGPTFEIGAHGRSHRLLAQLSDADIREELTASKATLENILGRKIESLAFPGGSYNARVVSIANEVGYRWLCTSEIGLSDWSTGGSQIPRVPIKSNIDEQTFARYLKGNLRPEKFRSTLLTVLRRLLGRRGYALLRSRLLGEETNQQDMTHLLSPSASTTPVYAGRTLG